MSSAFVPTPRPRGHDGVALLETKDHLHALGEALSTGDLVSARRFLTAAQRALGHNPEPARRPFNLVGGVPLTERELATLRCLPDGALSQKDIARKLGVTRNTVKTHLKSLYLKLGVHCRAEAIHRATELGWLLDQTYETSRVDADEYGRSHCRLSAS